MYIDWFSYFFGAIVVLVIPVMTVIVYIDSYRGTTRHERLSAWQLVTLTTTTMLAAYTYFYVRPYGEPVLIAAMPLWQACGFGIVLSLALGFAKRQLTVKRHRLEARLTKVVFQP